MFNNGSYQLTDTSSELHKTRVNGWRLKPYFSQILDNQEKAAQVNLDSDEPLGEIAQDPFLAQHAPYIESMNIGPITRPCIGIVLHSPGTTSGHLATGGKDECTSSMQRANGDDLKRLEQEA